MRNSLLLIFLVSFLFGFLMDFNLLSLTGGVGLGGVALGVEEIPLGATLTEINDFEPSTWVLQSSVNFKGNNYRYHEELTFGRTNSTTGEPDSRTAPSIETSLTSGIDDYEDEVNMHVKEGSIGYYFVFDEMIDLTQASKENMVKINFLGKTFYIYEIATDEFGAYTGNVRLLKNGERTFAINKTVTLKDVAQDSVIVCVDTCEIVREREIKNINGVDIFVEGIFYSDLEQSAEVLIGVADIFSTGDRYCDLSRCWEWVIDNLKAKSGGDIYSGGGPTIGLKNDFWLKHDNAVSTGKCISLPNNYLNICFDKLVPEEYANYEVRVEENELIVETSLDNGLKVGGKRTDKITLSFSNANDINIKYREDNQMVLSSVITPIDGSCTNLAEVNYDKSSGKIKFCLSGVASSANNMQLTLDVSGSEGLAKDDDINIGLSHSGTSFNGLRTLHWKTTNIGTKEEDLRTPYGIVIGNPDDALQDETLELKVPNEQVRAVVSVK